MKNRFIVTIFIFCLFIVPVLITPFPPATDLPQHLSQIHLLIDTLKTDNGIYTIQWTAPNTFVYVFIYLLWQILPLELVGRGILILMILFWILAIHILSAKRGIPIESAIFASLLIFNLSLYWGLLNFFVGFPIFVIWFALTSKDQQKTSFKDLLLLIVLSLFLYLSHALWFAVGAAWLFLINLVKKTPWRSFFLRLTALLPIVVLSLIWFFSFAPSRTEAGFKTAADWPWLPFRFSFGSLISSTFGGIRGPAELIVFCVICVWVALLIRNNRRQLNILFDKELLIAGFFFLAIFVLAPSAILNTIFFSGRWCPIAMIFLILSLRLPLKDTPKTRAIPAFIALGFIVMTSLAWHNFSSKELAGFKDSLDHIPPGSSVLGLDRTRRSDYLKGEPFFQMFSYAQAFKGCELSFSFAEHGTGIVAFKEIRKIPWTRRLEWYPENTKKSDLLYFDYVLVNTEEKLEKYLVKAKELVRLTSSGPWQLYKVLPAQMSSENDLFQDDYLFFPSSSHKNKK